MKSLSKNELGILYHSNLLAGIDKENFNLFAAAVKKKIFKKGEYIIRQKEIGKGLYFILKGSAEVYAEKTEHVPRITFNRLETGDFIGEYSLLDDLEASAHVQCTEKTETACLSAIDFSLMVEENDAIGKVVFRNMLQTLVSRLREKDKEIDLIR